MSSLYSWLKVVHLFGMVAWMAGIFYLPRLFVYHADSKPGSEQSETFKVMERRLLRGIMLPAMVVTWLCGIGLTLVTGAQHSLWLMAKVVLVLGLSGYHGWLSRRRRDFEADANRVSIRTFRIVNEVPTLILLAILVLVVFRPF